MQKKKIECRLITVKKNMTVDGDIIAGPKINKKGWSLTTKGKIKVSTGKMSKKEFEALLKAIKDSPKL